MLPIKQNDDCGAVLTPDAVLPLDVLSVTLDVMSVTLDVMSVMIDADFDVFRGDASRVVKASDVVVWPEVRGVADVLTSDAAAT